METEFFYANVVIGKNLIMKKLYFSYIQKGKLVGDQPRGTSNFNYKKYIFDLASWPNLTTSLIELNLQIITSCFSSNTPVRSVFESPSIYSPFLTIQNGRVFQPSVHNPKRWQVFTFEVN